MILLQETLSLDWKRQDKLAEKKLKTSSSENINKSSQIMKNDIGLTIYMLLIVCEAPV
jgi:hypothetical protein